MKKILIVVVVLLLVVLGSPGIVGKLAESTMNDQLGWAVAESTAGEFAVQQESLDSHWFTSTGVHYVSLGDGDLQKLMMDSLGILDPASLPRLRIDTHIDHGLIPVSSIHRDGGSLAPALGSAKSTMTLELYDDEPFAIPGAIYTQLGLTGGIDSEYILPAGSFADGDESASWEDASIRVKATPSSGRVVATGLFPGLSLVEQAETIEVGEIRFELDQRPADSGLYVGDFSMQMASMEVAQAATPAVTFGPMTMTATSSEAANRLDSDVVLALDIPDAPMLGDIEFRMDMELLGANATALKSLSDAANALDDSVPPELIYSMLEDDLIVLATSGLTLKMDSFDIRLPQGLIDASLQVVVPESDASDFSWAGVLQLATGEASLSMPSEIVQLATMASPEANMLIAMGFLQENGALYTMSAKYEKGLLTVNGNPLPIPMPGI